MSRERTLVDTTEKRPPRDSETLIELLVGILFLSLMAQLFILALFDKTLYLSIGLWVGASLALLLAWHMHRSLKAALDMGELGAQKHMRIQAALRYLVVVAIMVLAAWTKIGNVVTMFLGVLTLKLSAYLQPLTHRVMSLFRR